MIRHLATYIAIAGFLAISCSPDIDHTVKISKNQNSYSVTLHTPEIAEKCYAPDSIRFNPMLDLPNFVAVNRWTIAPNEPVSLDHLNEIFSYRRKKVGSTVELFIPRDSVSVRPSYLTFVAFPCDAPTAANGWKGDTLMIVASADVPTFYPPGYREPGAGDANSMDGMMLNITPAKGGLAQRH